MAVDMGCFKVLVHDQGASATPRRPQNSIQFKCICIAFFTIHASKQLYRKCISEIYIDS